MFESLAEKIKEDDDQVTNTKERVALWSVVMIVSLLVFGGLYLAVRALG